MSIFYSSFFGLRWYFLWHFLQIRAVFDDRVCAFILLLNLHLLPLTFFLHFFQFSRSLFLFLSVFMLISFPSRKTPRICYAFSISDGMVPNGKHTNVYKNIEHTRTHTIQQMRGRSQLGMCNVNESASTELRSFPIVSMYRTSQWREIHRHFVIC